MSHLRLQAFPAYIAFAKAPLHLRGRNCDEHLAFARKGRPGLVRIHDQSLVFVIPHLRAGLIIPAKSCNFLSLKCTPWPIQNSPEPSGLQKKYTPNLKNILWTYSCNQIIELNLNINEISQNSFKHQICI